MILYLDTSALVKLYIIEPSSDQVHQLVESAETVAVSRIAWAEFHAALSRRSRETPTDANSIEAAKELLTTDWPQYLVLEVTQEVVEKAGEFADIFALRGFDAIHLATADLAKTKTQHPVHFKSFDTRQTKAATILHLNPEP